MTAAPTLLTDPFLQLPEASTVRVVWFTEFEGSQHAVHYGDDGQQTAIAHTTKLTRVREDQDSQIADPPSHPVPRSIWRHEAIVTGLTPDQRVPYRVSSTRADGATVHSDTFTLAAQPSPGRSLKVLLTSDHQLKPMVAANLQKVVETVGQLDLVLMAGDLVNIPDRASEWFDDRNGGAFFPALQGRATLQLPLGKTGETAVYRGAAIVQSTPMYTAIGNHEVMGRFSSAKTLKEQFNDPVPRTVAEQRYKPTVEWTNPTNNPKVRDAWIKNHSFNSDTYEQIFTLPTNPTGNQRYYAVTFGDIRLIVLYATNVWRSPNLAPDVRGKYRERTADLNTPEAWGYGQHIFEAIAPGSAQYTWLQAELRSPEFQAAPYKIVMLHHPPHSIGENSVPPYTDPVQQIDRDRAGQVSAIRYEYPQSQDYLLRDVMPILEQAGVHLVFYGHSHLWNRFVSPTGTHYLESSNVGNSYGAFIGKHRRPVPTNDQETYVETGNPGGLDPIVPTLAPLRDEQGQPLPYLASNELTAFSILDTGTGTISSYYFDTHQPQSPVVKFDEFNVRS